MKKIRYPLLICALLVPLQLFSQQLNFQVYSVNKGLPHPQVHDIAQTDEGYIWMATYGGGLTKFDGSTFTNFTTRDGLRDNLVEEIVVDENDNVWLATDKGGVAKFQGDSLVYPIENDSLANYSIGGMEELSDGSLWFGTYMGGIFVYKDNKIKRLTTSDGLSSNAVWDFEETSDGKVWIGTINGISIYDGRSFDTLLKKDGLAGDRVYKIVKTKNGNIWIGTDNGISIWDGEELRNIGSIHGNQLDSIYDILQTSDGKIWLATMDQGVYTYEEGQFDHITEKNGLSSNFTYNLFEDQDNRIWIGTDEDGVNLYKENGFLFYNKDTGLANNEILSVLGDQEGTFWLGTTEGIESFDGTSFHKHPLPKKYKNPNIWNVINLPNGNKLVDLPDGLMEFDGNSYSNFSEKYNLGELFIYDLHIDSSNDLWIGSDSGLYKVDLQSGEVKLFTADDGLANDRVFHIFEDRKGRKWIGTYYGLNLFDGQDFKTFRIDDGLVHNQVNYITQDDKGDIWVGTRGGISVLKSAEDPKSLDVDNFNRYDGMTLLNTHFLWFDSKGFLWQGTNGGLQRFDVESYRETGRMAVSHYPLSSGGIGLEFNFHALASDSKRQVWMGSMGGLVHLNPGKLKNEPLLNLAITDIKVNTQPVGWADHTEELNYHNGQLDFPSVTFPYDKNIFEFSFKGVSFSNAGDINYRYKLKGFKDEWMPATKGNSAIFTNLNPGKYTFVVQAKHDGGQFTDNITEYNFAIAFPFWRTYWFYGLMMISVVGFIYGYIRIRINKLEKERLQELVDKQTEHLTKALKEKEVLIKEIHHRVKNNLAVISGLLELQMGYTNNDFVSRVLSESQRRVQSISMIHEKLYQNERLAEINFEKYVQELIQNIEYSHNDPSKEIEVEISIDQFKLGVDQGIPCGLILNELVSNAYEHAFEGCDHGKIEISITKDDDQYLTMVVLDNGRGLDSDIDMSQKETLGLSLIDSLCTQLEGEYEYKEVDTGTHFVLKFKKEEAPPKVPT